MQVWKRRLAVVLAVGAGSAGVMMSTTAGAQTSPPTTFPSITFPTFPPFPTFPSIPPPTMPPPTSPPTSTPPPTMPPPTSPTSTPPPTMPPPTSVPFPDLEEVIEDLIDRLDNLIEQGEAGYEEFQELLDELRSRFLD